MTLKKVLNLDAVTCALMGVALTVAAAPLSELLALPQSLLFYAGCLLFPIAAFMAVLARHAMPSPAGVWLVILGNAGWVVASIVVLAVTGPNMLGVGFLVIQALAVALLALAEFNALARRPAGIA
ncbi:MAG: hypothetical protein IBJ07_20350 [Rhizobiaceae bacterium]|nr:hypothetical protein [Rhizobiaceae bacterium]